MLNHQNKGKCCNLSLLGKLDNVMDLNLQIKLHHKVQCSVFLKIEFTQMILKHDNLCNFEQTNESACYCNTKNNFKDTYLNPITIRFEK